MLAVDALLCVLCVTLVSVGQVLMRAAAQVAKTGSATGFSAWLNATSLVAVGVYAIAMLLWLWILGRVPLSQAFAFFGLTFMMVPFLAHHFLGDPVNIYTWVGAIVIIVGVLIGVHRPV